MKDRPTRKEPRPLEPTGGFVRPASVEVDDEVEATPDA